MSMNTIVEFFEQITGISLNLSHNPTLVLVLVFGFLIVYEIIHIVFGSAFGFMNNRK